MNILRQVGDFILSSWIWQFTADWFHPVITGIVMFLMLRLIMRRSRLRSLWISLTAQLVALGLLTIIAIGILVHLFGWEFAPIDPHEGIKQISAFAPSIYLGVLYAIFQSCMFIFGAFFWEINLIGYLLISWMSNGIGAILSYMFISMAEVMKYTG